MKTNIIMKSSALFLGFSGIFLTFNPSLFLQYLNIKFDIYSILFTQVLGALYFAFGMLNWMSKESIFGGIYNRPIVISNFSYFIIVGIAFLKLLMNNHHSMLFILGSIFHTIYSLLFGMILIYNPINHVKK